MISKNSSLVKFASLIMVAIMMFAILPNTAEAKIGGGVAVNFFMDDKLHEFADENGVDMNSISITLSLDGKIYKHQKGSQPHQIKVLEVPDGLYDMDINVPGYDLELLRSDEEASLTKVRVKGYENSLYVKCIKKVPVLPDVIENPTGPTPDTHVRITFNAGDHGKLDSTHTSLKGQAKITYDIKKGMKFSDVPVPTVKPDDNWGFDRWDPALPAPGSAVADGSFTVLYKDTRPDVIPTDPEEPNTPEGYVLVKFVAGENGKLEDGATAFNVLKGTPFSKVKAQMPKPVADKGYIFDKWSPALPSNDTLINEDATYTALFRVSGHGGGDPYIPDDSAGEIVDPTPGKPEEIDHEIIYGEDRIETAIELSKKYYDKADHVIVVRHDLFPDSLTASVLAKALDAPILLTASDKLDTRVAAEIERLGATMAYIVGGEVSITPSTADEIKAITGETERIGGPNRYDTSALVAAKVVSIVGEKGVAVVASGEVYPDALAISPFAAANGYPILLVSRDSIPEVISEAIKDLSITKTYVVGGENTIAKSVEEKLPGVEMRLAGADRYATAVEIAKTLHSNAKTSFVASGEVFADALVVGPIAAKFNAPILLTAAKTAPQVTSDYIKAAGFEKLIFVGGPNTISSEVIKKLVTK